MNAQAAVAIILALCVLVFFVAFPLLRYLLPADLIPNAGLIEMYRETVGAIIGALGVYIGYRLRGK
jgi:hypothetical protein